MIYFLIYYPDTTLPPTESAQEYKRSQAQPLSAPPKGLQGFGEKVGSRQGFVGFNGFYIVFIALNQPNANPMPISRKPEAFTINSPSALKLPQIDKITPDSTNLREPRPCPRSHTSPAYMTLVTRPHAIPHNARCTPHITRPYVTQHNPCGTNLYHLQKALDGRCYGLGSDLN